MLESAEVLYVGGSEFLYCSQQELANLLWTFANQTMYLCREPGSVLLLPLDMFKLLLPA